MNKLGLSSFCIHWDQKHWQIAIKTFETLENGIGNVVKCKYSLWSGNAQSCIFSKFYVQNFKLEVRRRKST